jgi:hypothetical protein
VRAEVPLIPRAIALLTDLLGKVQDDGDREAMILLGKLDRRFAGLGLEVRRIDDRQPT